LTAWQKAFYLAPRMSPEALYDTDADKWSMHNLAGSDKPEHQAVLKRLRGVIQKWIEETKDQGRTLEPEELAKNLGRTKPGTKPLAGYQLEEVPAKSKKP
jgi:hypothetical protein